ncbi:MAG TPA: carbohydrate ABC transporter permease [Clostridiaceae bacterium]|nr:carbohydrate ABC transporter permease [Clostridiaceae bacterium]
MNTRNQSFISKLLSQILMIIMTFSIIMPLYFMFTNSFKERHQYVRDALSLPSPFTLQNYIEAFRGKNFVEWFKNSIILTFCSAAVTMVIALLAAYAFAKLHFKGKRLLFRFIIPLMSVPPVAMIIPQFRMIKTLGMVNTLQSVIIIYTGIMLPMTIYMFRNFLIDIPDSLLEAARIDGCSRFMTLIKIVAPLSVPVIITSSVVNIVWVWNELLIALVFLQKESLRTLIVGITLFRGRFTLNVPVILAGLGIVSIPMIIVYIFAQKHLVEGLLAGSVKG